MMKCDGRVAPSFNVQAVVDAESQVVAAVRVTEAEHDHGQLCELLEMVEENAGAAPGVVVADTGYCDEGTLRGLEETGQEALIPPQKHSQEDKREGDEFSSRQFALDEDRDVMICPEGRELVFGDETERGHGAYRRYVGTECGSCDRQEECCRGRPSRRVSISVVHSLRLEMQEKLETAEGKALYALRKESVEPVFGQWKANLGFRRFLLRGKNGAAAEVALMGLAHNLRKCAVRVLNSPAAVIFRLVCTFRRLTKAAPPPRRFVHAPEF